MPVPSKMSDLFTLPASNSPQGSDAIGNSLDDYIRATQAIIRSTNALSSASIASGSTTDLGTSDGEAVTVTGTTTITSFGTTPSGIVREVTFSGILTITNSAAIALGSGANYTTTAGDVLTFRSQGSGNWKQVTSTPIGFIPVQQGGGAGQLPNKIYLGWAAGAKLKAQVDATDLGNVALESWVSTTYAPIASPNLTGTVNLNLGTLGTTLFSTLNGTLLTASDGNSDKLSTFIFRNTASGTGFGSAAWRLQRIVDSTSMGYLQFGDGVSPSGDSNQVIVGNNLGGTFLLNGSGNCIASGTITCTNLIATSDKNKKDRIRARKARERLPSLLKFCQWLWKEDGTPGLGVIAQEVQKVAPEYVQALPDGTLGVDKASLALECVIALAVRVEALEGK